MGKSNAVLHRQVSPGGFLDDYNAPSLEHRRDLLTRLLLSRMEGRPHQQAIQATVQRIDAAAGNPSMRALADELGWSQKHLERLFVQAVGLSPKHYARIARFQHLSCCAAGGRLWLLRPIPPGQGSDHPGRFGSARVFLSLVPTLWRGFAPSREVSQPAALIQTDPSLSNFYKTTACGFGMLRTAAHQSRAQEKQAGS